MRPGIYSSADQLRRMGQRNDVGRLDPIDLQDLLLCLSRNGVVDVHYHNCLATSFVPGHLHAGDVYLVGTEDHTDATDDTWAIAVMGDKQITCEGSLQREAIDFEDASVDPIPADRYPMRIAAIHLEGELGYTVGISVGRDIGNWYRALLSDQARVDRRHTAIGPVSECIAQRRGRHVLDDIGETNPCVVTRT